MGQVRKAKYEERFIVINCKHLGKLEKNTDFSFNVWDFKRALKELALALPINNKYYVCNQDEPYAKQVIDIILEGEARKIFNRKSQNNTNTTKPRLEEPKGNMDELKPCPFCGEQPKIIQRDTDLNSYDIGCGTMGCCLELGADWWAEKQYITNLWNTRK